MKKFISMILSAAILLEGAVSVFASGDSRVSITNPQQTDTKLTYTVNISDGESGVLIGAMYNSDNALIEVREFGTDAEQTASFDLPETAEGGTVKFFLWNSLAGMKPLGSAAEANWYKNVKPTLSPSAPPTDSPVPESNIELDRSTYTLYVGNSRTLDSSDTAWKTNGDYFTLNADVLTDNYGENDIEWSVSDEEIIKIKSSNDGTADVQALRTGFADVYASMPDGGKAVCHICVIDNYCRLTVQKIEFNIDNLTLAINDAAQVKPILYPKSVYDNGMLDKTLSWSSSDASVAEVSSDGTVTAKSAGKAIITAVSADVERKASFNVTVKDSIGATGITADNAEIKNVKVGETVQLSASADSDIIWKSENSFVADVDENGLVTAYSNSNKQVVTSDGAKVTEEADTVKIYATTAEGGYIAEFDLCISDADVDVQSVDIDAENIALAAGTTKNITAVIAPANILEQSVTWTSDNESIVTVEKTDNTIYGANQAVLTAVGSGTAHITASYGGKSDKCTVTVTESTVKAHSVSVKTSKEIDIDEVYQLTASVDENVTNKEIIWLGTNADIATVDREGNVMGYSAGTIKIYAIAADSLTEDEVTQLKSLRHDKRVIEESDIRDIIDGAIYSVCELTVKDSSPYLRNLHAPDEAITDCSVNLLWNRASLLQAADFKEYRVYQDDELIAVTDNLGYTVDNLSPSTEYSFKVTAVDNAYNEIISETLKVTTAEKSAVINVLDYGARGDGTTLDTYAIQSAINACPKGGTVWLPDGVYYSGALFLKSDMKFKVDGILIGSIDPKDYPHIISKWEGWRKLPQTADEWDNSETGSDKYLEENEYAHSSLINIGVYHEGENSVTGPYSAENIIICGNGQINGNGFALAYNEGPNHKKRENNTSYFKADAPVTDPTTRGKTILLHNAQNVYIKDILVSYSPSWTVHAIYCDNVTFDNMKVISQGRGNVGEGSTVKLAGHLFNGDGIDPESCTNINIFNTYFRTGDDSVTLKSGRNREGNELDKPNAYVRITDCETNFSLGGFGTGSENAGGAHDILYQNLKADTMAIYGMWFKTNEARGGLTENIQIRDVDLKNANTAICINHTYSSSTNNPAAEKPVLRNVTIENANGSGVSKAYNFEGLSSSKIENITILGGTITDSSGSSVKYGKKFDIRNVGGTTWSWSNGEDITVYIERIETDTKINILDEIAIKKVDNDNKTVTVYKGATGQNLLDGVSSQEGGKQTYSLSSDSLAELAGNETLTVTSPDGSCIENYTVIVSDEAMDTSSYIIAENFTSTTGDWGFTGTGKAAVEDDGTLSLLSDKKNNTSVTKELDVDISSQKKINIRFDWQSHASGGNGSYFALRDEEDNLIFVIWGHGQDKYGAMSVSTKGTDVADLDKLETLSDDKYRVNLTLDFDAGTISGTVTNLTDNKVLKTFDSETLSCSPKNLAKMYAYDIYGAARMSLDNVYIKAVE